MKNHTVKRLWARAIAMVLVAALGSGYAGAGFDSGAKATAIVAADGKAEKIEKTEKSEKTDKTDKVETSEKSVKEDQPSEPGLTKYWSFEASGTLNRPLALKDGWLLITTENGYISIVDSDGKRVFHRNVYADLTDPAMNEKGEIWITGKGARLYRYDDKGNGEMTGMFYFQGRKDGLIPSSAVVDGEGRPYFAYQHAILSLNAKGAKEATLLPTGVAVVQLVPAGKGVYALGSNGVLYAVHAGKIVWQVKLEQTLQKAKLAADGEGGVVLAADKALAAYDAKGKARFAVKLAAAPAGGWTSPLVIGGDKGMIIAAEQSGNGIAAFRLADGAELWRASAGGAGGFGPAALARAPEAGGGGVLAASRSGAVFAIDGEAGTIAKRFGGSDASAAGGVTVLGGEVLAYAAGKVLVKAGPYQPVSIAYATAALKLQAGQRLLLADKLKLSESVALRYTSDNTKVVSINADSIVTTVAAGKANITVEVAAAGYKGQLKLPVEVAASTSALRATHAVQRVTVAGRTFSVQTVTIPKGMPVTLGTANRAVGTSQSLADLAKGYGAQAAINGTFFSAYAGAPEPYGMLIKDGNIAHIGNTGTSIGFTWDGTVLMDHLRVKIAGGTNGSYTHPNNWYVYFVNRIPAKGATSAVMFTPAKGARIGFDYGTAITVRQGVVTDKSRNKNVAIPGDGYVLVFAGAEEKLADRFAVGTTVEYKTNTTDLGGKAIDWSRVHTAVGAGPRLVKDGKVTFTLDTATAEGFTESKILTTAAARSGILVKQDGTVILATVPGATMRQWADIMVKLGARQAMNLDGGASSGLYANGKLATTPGRLISNALVFGTQLKW